jgi:hypothetical protein
VVAGSDKCPYGRWNRTGRSNLRRSLRSTAGAPPACALSHARQRTNAFLPRPWLGFGDRTWPTTFRRNDSATFSCGLLSGAKPSCSAMAEVALCAVCGIRAGRVCHLCGDVGYCCAEHQFGDWTSRHKDECTYASAGVGT